MSIGRWLMGAGVLVAAGAAGEYALARYFMRRTLIRSNAKRERTQDMSGTNWGSYIPTIRASKERRAAFPQEDVYITSFDGLQLHGTWFPYEESDRTVICFHGYTSEGMNDYSTIAEYYRENRFNLLLVDERAHGKSEGKYIGFGCLDRRDARSWIDYVISRVGESSQIMLHGISMGGSTVLMTSGLELPEQVKGIISDCAFTSAWAVFSSVLKVTYHLPSFPMMHISDWMTRREAGYGLKECNAREEVKKSKTPTVFIHGDADTFVPFSMVHELYEACAAPKELVVIQGAGHAEACYKEPELYEKAIGDWIARYFE